PCPSAFSPHMSPFLCRPLLPCRYHLYLPQHCPFFFFTETATTELYTLSLHDALPIYPPQPDRPAMPARPKTPREILDAIDKALEDRKSTRLNSSHGSISYAVFCLKKKKRAVWMASILPSKRQLRLVD